MKEFYDGIFMNRMDLANIGINYPVKLEYYKTKSNVLEEKNDKRLKYGIQVVKKSYKKEKTNIENSVIEELTDDESIINKILDILKRNEVTPISAQYVIEDLFKEMC